MTGPIKPPSSKPPVSELVPKTTEGAGSARFREALAAQDAETAQKAQGARATSDPIVDALREGRLDAKGAVDALVARALESDTARALTPAGRVALEQHLRTQLADDPAFQRLIRDLG